MLARIAIGVFVLVWCMASGVAIALVILLIMALLRYIE